MRETPDKISSRQLIALDFVFILSSLVRNVPGRTAALAGSGAWLSVLLALIPIGLLMLALRRLLGGEGFRLGLGQTLLLGCGRFGGRLVLSLFFAWFVLAAGFLLRSGADRFMTTIYPSSGPGVFVITMLLVCLPAAAGQLKALARSAVIFRIFLLAVLAFVFACSLPKIRLGGLWQLAPGSEKDVLFGALTAANPVCICVYPLFFSHSVRDLPRRGSVSGWLGIIFAAAFLLVLSAMGTLGAELTAKIHNPFFAVARDITIFGSIEHMEAVIATVWVFSDFIIVSLMLRLAAFSLQLILCRSGQAARFGLSPRAFFRLLVAFCSAAVMAVGLLIAPEAVDMRTWGEKIIPAVNMSLAFLVLPASLALGKARRRRGGAS